MSICCSPSGRRQVKIGQDDLMSGNLPCTTRRCASNSTGNAWKSAEVPPWKRRDHKGEEGPGGNWQTETHANRCCRGPRKWKRDGDVRRNGYLEEALVPPARRFRSLRDFDEY